MRSTSGLRSGSRLNKSDVILKKYHIKKIGGRWKAWSVSTLRSGIVVPGPRFAAKTWDTAMLSVLLSIELDAEERKKT